MSVLLYLNQENLKLTCKYLKDVKSKTYKNDYKEMEYSAIVINNESGYSYRSFTRDVNFIRTNEYKSVLTMVYTCINPSIVFPNRMGRKYRNHFCAYTGLDNSILIALTETTRQLPDQDAVVEYHYIKPNNAAIGFCCDRKWCVSFDKCIYKNQLPESFSNYTLYSSGEWWYFENGLILNGVENSEYNSCNCLIYLELHPTYSIKSDNKLINSKLSTISALSHQSAPTFLREFLNSQSFNTQKSPTPHQNELNNQTTNDIRATILDDLVNNEQQISSSVPMTANVNSLIQPSNILPFANSIVGPSNHVINNDRENAPDKVLQNLLPSLWWFKIRDCELKKGDIGYFIPSPIETFNILTC